MWAARNALNQSCQAVMQSSSIIASSVTCTPGVLKTSENTSWLWRGFADDAAPADDKEEEERKARVAEVRKGGRYGVKLGKTHPEKLHRMRQILGYYPTSSSSSSSDNSPSSTSPPTASKTSGSNASSPSTPAASAQGVERVTISLLQTMRYLEIDANTRQEQQLKSKLVDYRISSLNRDLLPQLARTRQFMAEVEKQQSMLPLSMGSLAVPSVSQSSGSSRRQ